MLLPAPGCTLRYSAAAEAGFTTGAPAAALVESSEEGEGGRNPPLAFASLLPLAFLRCLLGICGLRPAARPCGSLLLAGSSRFVRPPGGIAEVWGLLGGVPVVSCCLVGEHCEGAQDGAGD